MRLVGLAIVLALATIAPGSAQEPANASSPSSAQHAQQKSYSECVQDPGSYLALSYENFDQGVQPVDGGPRREWGWRPIARQKGCESAAATLISQWRQRYGSTLNPTQQSLKAFHEGQMRAAAGDFPGAIPLIEAGRVLFSDAAGQPYVDALLAFLRSDRDALIAARERLLAVPEPANWPELQRKFREEAGQEMKWPRNIEATDALVRCFEKSYPAFGEC